MSRGECKLCGESDFWEQDTCRRADCEAPVEKEIAVEELYIYPDASYDRNKGAFTANVYSHWAGTGTAIHVVPKAKYDKVKADYVDMSKIAARARLDNNCLKREIEALDRKILGHVDANPPMSGAEPFCSCGKLQDQARSGECVRCGLECEDLRDAEIVRLRGALAKIDEIRNSIIGYQSVNWSAHIYPLVAALGKAGYEGLGYKEASAKAQTQLDLIDKLEGRIGLGEILARVIEHAIELRHLGDGSTRKWAQNALIAWRQK